MADSQGLLYTSMRNGYLPGEQVQAELCGLDGAPAGLERFQVLAYVGGGFAGQVYQALPASARWDEPPRPVALKILKPKNPWQRCLRDGLFQVCFQTTFAARLRAPAVQSGLIWQALLREAAARSLGPGSVAQPRAYFWDAGQASYVEVHAWIAARPLRYQADDRTCKRDGNPVKATETDRRRTFMRGMARLCQEAGASGLARQYQWWTLVSPANVLIRQSPPEGEAAFTAIDFRPGLAVPFLLPISPAHLVLILKGLLRGQLVHYDEIDLARLKRFSHQHGAHLRAVRELVPHLRQAEAAHRYARPGLWQSRLGFLRSRARRRAAGEALVEDWARLGQVDLQSAMRLKASRGLFWLAYFCGWLPLVGGLVRTVFFHAGFRAHLKALLSQAAYLKLALQAAKARDLAVWAAEGRVSSQHLARLERSTGRYCLERLALGWLPAGWQRLLGERVELRRALSRLLVQPLRLLLRPAYRLAWLRGILQEQAERGLITEQQRTTLEGQLREPRLAGFTRDLGLTIGLELFSKVIYALLAVYGLTSGDFWPLALAALGPVPPSGVIRAGYLLVLLAWELPGIWRKGDQGLLRSRLLGLAVAPWRWVGNLFAPLEMFSSYPELSLLLGEHFVRGMLRAVPVLGRPGLVLEYWAFQIAYNLPLCLLGWLEARAR